LQEESKGFREGERIAKLSVYTLLALGIVEIVFSQVSGSVSLLADGIDSISDAVVSFFVYTGLRFARRKPSRKFQYGYYKVESFTALITAIALVGVGVFTFLRSYRAFTDPGHAVLLPSWALGVLLFAGTVSLYRSLQMRQIANRYNILSLKTDARNSIKDASASFIAFGSVFVASFGGLSQVDALGGMLIAFYIITVAYVALRESSLVLLDAFHDPEMTREIESIIKSNKHVVGIRELRLRRAGPFIVGTLEIIVDGRMTISQVHSVRTELENSVKSRIAGLRTLVVLAIPQASSSGTAS
jgi:cation diffusion facilitator family transporter